MRSPINRSGHSAPGAEFALAFCLLLASAGLLLLAGGCAHSRDDELAGVGFNRVFAPQPPTFLNGPMAVLLTNAQGFSARVEVQNEPLGGLEPVQSGQFLSRGSKLLFAPEPGKKAPKQPRGGFSFLWDVADNRGFVLSEALQGYTSVGSGLRVTNLVAGSIPGSPQNFEGHPCEQADASVQTSDGSVAIFRLLRAQDLKGFPVQLRGAATNPVTLTLTFSKIRLEPPPADLFTVPDGFTKYPNPEAMADEVVLRQHNLKAKPTAEPRTFDNTTPQAPRRY